MSKSQKEEGMEAHVRKVLLRIFIVIRGLEITRYGIRSMPVSLNLTTYLPTYLPQHSHLPTPFLTFQAPPRTHTYRKITSPAHASLL